MKRLLTFAFLILFTTQAHAGFWDSITSWFSDDAEETTEVTEQASPSATSALVQQGLQLLPFLVQQLGITDTQASGGMGSLLQAATAMLSEGDGNTLLGAIPQASALMKSAPSGDSGDGGMLSGALAAAGEYSETAKVASQLTSQFKSLGMGADMIPKFTESTETYLSNNGKSDAASLLTSALSSVL